METTQSSGFFMICNQNKLKTTFDVYNLIKKSFFSFNL